MEEGNEEIEVWVLEQKHKHVEIRKMADPTGVTQGWHWWEKGT